MRAPIDLAKATPALIAFFEISEPSVGIKMCLNMLASFRAGPIATLPGAGSDELIQIKESPARKTIGARRAGSAQSDESARQPSCPGNRRRISGVSTIAGPLGMI